MISLDLFWRELINGYGFCIAIKLRYLHIQCYVHAVMKIWLLYNVRSVWSIAQIQMIQKEILSKRNTTTKWSDVFQQKDQPHQIGCSWIIRCSEHFRLERLMFAIKHQTHSCPVALKRQHAFFIFHEQIDSFFYHCCCCCIGGFVPFVIV